MRRANCRPRRNYARVNDRIPLARLQNDVPVAIQYVESGR